MLHKNSVQQLDQLLELLEFIKDEDYTQPMEKVYNSSIGKHTRHIIEFYQLFHKSYSKKIINYAKRKRFAELENDRKLAIESLKDLKLKLGKVLNEKDLVLKVKIEGETYFMPTTVAREYLYLFEHTTHHLALIRLGLSNLYPDLTDFSHMGIAYSTPKK